MSYDKLATPERGLSVLPTPAPEQWGCANCSTEASLTDHTGNRCRKRGAANWLPVKVS